MTISRNECNEKASDLMRAQKHALEFAPVHEQIVDSLRKSGMSREDAVEFADEVEAKDLAKKECDV